MKCTLLVEECALLLSSARFLQHFWSENSFRFGVFGCAERSRGVPEPILWYNGTFRFNEYAPGAVRDEVVGLQPSFEHLPPLLKPCFSVALHTVLIYDMGVGTSGASLFLTIEMAPSR